MFSLSSVRGYSSDRFETMKIERIEYDTEAYRKVCRFRDQYLRQPLGLRLTEADTKGEAAQFHYVAAQEGEIVGCIVVVPLGEGTFQFRQMAVESRFRKRGIGRRLLQHVEREVREMGGHLFVLDARESAVPFYQKQGYVVISDPFEQVGIVHLRMQKDASRG